MTCARSHRKGFSRSNATLTALALFLSLSAPGTADLALAQYIPPPATQNFTPSPALATPQAETPRAARPSSRATRASATRRPAATVEEAAPAESRKADVRASRRAARKARAEARAAARAEAREARQAQRTRNVRKPTIATQAAVAEESPDATVSPRDNARSVTLLAGDPQTTNARSAEDIATLLASSGFEVTPRTGPISLTQLAEPEGDADLAIVKSDALETARRDKGGALTRKLVYVARLYNEEVHVIARPGIASFADLDGRTVATGAADTPEARATAALFERAGLAPRFLPMDQKLALERLGRGEIDAAVFIGGKPAPSLTDLHVAGLRLISIPYKGALQDFYYPARITAADYPHLVAAGGEIDTVATSTLLMAVDAKPNTLRHRRLTQFTDVFFDRFATLRGNDHHPKWREVNLAAEVPGWRRFMPAQKWLDRAPAPRVSSVK